MDPNPELEKIIDPDPHYSKLMRTRNPGSQFMMTKNFKKTLMEKDALIFIKKFKFFLGLGFVKLSEKPRAFQEEDLTLQTTKCTLKIFSNCGLFSSTGSGSNSDP